MSDFGSWTAGASGECLLVDKIFTSINVLQSRIGVILFKVNNLGWPDIG